MAAALAASMALAGLALAALLLGGCARAPQLGWRPVAAAHYLDQRAQEWLDWSKASRSHGTVCVSCHTALPYALARDALGRLTGQTALPAPQRQLLESVRTRVRLWGRLPPYYGGSSTAASFGTEAVLNALVLATQDAHTGHASASAQAALANMWAAQRSAGPQAGSWDWLQFGKEPWEAVDSVYYGATLAALAVGSTPPAYQRRPDVQAGLVRLRDYLARAYPSQPLLNRIDLLWAGDHLPGLITSPVRETILGEIWSRQRADGGWSIASLMPGWRRRDGSAQPLDSDGYATGFVSLVLQQSGIAPIDARLQRGLRWLEHHQSFWNGRWTSASLNRAHGLREGTIRHFMDDAATAFAVMALARAQAPPVSPRAPDPPPAPASPYAGGRARAPAVIALGPRRLAGR
jgi:squalene-hopene/tetraprenyl-beta-curcumene cyclase